MIDVDLNSYLGSQIQAHIEQDKVSEEAPQARIWLQIRDQNEELDLSGVGGIVETTFDVEAQSTDVATAQQMVVDIRRLLHGFHGRMGDSRVLVSLVKDHDDKYEPSANDAGFHVCSLQVQIFHRA